MKPFTLILAVLTLAATTPGLAETIRFTDGTELEVRSFEVRGDVFVMTTHDGKLRSVPLSRVDTAFLPDREAMIAEAIELMGLREMTDELSMAARQGVGNARLHQDIVTQALVEGFAAERLYAVAERVFRERAAHENLQPALEWLRSPLARRIGRGGARSTESLESYVESLSTSPPDGGRVELLLRIDRATGTSEAAVEMQVSMLRALSSALYPKGPGSMETLEQALDDARPRLAQKTRRRIQWSLHFMYRDASDEELVAYLEFLESDNGVWLTRVLLKSLFAAMEDGAARAGRALADRLRERSKLRAESRSTPLLPHPRRHDVVASSIEGRSRERAS